jgi:hypothetical protein
MTAADDSQDACLRAHGARTNGSNTATFCLPW